MNNYYCVWRRNDGLVCATTRMPNDYVGGDGSITTFISLGEFKNWQDTYNCLEENGGLEEKWWNEVGTL